MGGLSLLKRIPHLRCQSFVSEARFAVHPKQQPFGEIVCGICLYREINLVGEAIRIGNVNRTPFLPMIDLYKISFPFDTAEPSTIQRTHSGLWKFTV